NAREPLVRFRIGDTYDALSCIRRPRLDEGRSGSPPESPGRGRGLASRSYAARERCRLVEAGVPLHLQIRSKHYSWSRPRKIARLPKRTEEKGLPLLAKGPW